MQDYFLTGVNKNSSILNLLIYRERVMLKNVVQNN